MREALVARARTDRRVDTDDFAAATLLTIGEFAAAVLYRPPDLVQHLPGVLLPGVLRVDLAFTPAAGVEATPL